MIEEKKEKERTLGNSRKIYDILRNIKMIIQLNCSNHDNNPDMASSIKASIIGSNF